MNKLQLAVIYGSVMGDAYLQNNGKNVRLRFEHSKKQEDYVIWKKNFLADIFEADSIRKLSRVHPKTNKTYNYVRCQSKTLPELRAIKDFFYVNGKKIVPNNLSEFLKDPISLAVWFMDDGYYYQRDKCGYLYLGNVSRNEAETCRMALQNNFGLAVKILNKKLGFALYFSRIEMLKLKNLIGKLILPLFKYKIPSTP